MWLEVKKLDTPCSIAAISWLPLDVVQKGCADHSKNIPWFTGLRVGRKQGVNNHPGGPGVVEFFSQNSIFSYKKGNLDPVGHLYSAVILHKLLCYSERWSCRRVRWVVSLSTSSFRPQVEYNLVSIISLKWWLLGDSEVTSGRGKHFCLTSACDSVTMVGLLLLMLCMWPNHDGRMAYFAASPTARGMVQAVGGIKGSIQYCAGMPQRTSLLV